jgi:hypothetical protein
MPAAEAFPTVAELTVQVEEFSTQWLTPHQTLTFTRASFPDVVVRCSNPLCGSGRVSLDAVVSQAVRNGLTEHADSRPCGGIERTLRRRCWHMFAVTVRIRYKAQP